MRKNELIKKLNLIEGDLEVCYCDRPGVFKSICSLKQESHTGTILLERYIEQ